MKSIDEIKAKLKMFEERLAYLRGLDGYPDDIEDTDEPIFLEEKIALLTWVLEPPEKKNMVQPRLVGSGEIETILKRLLFNLLTDLIQSPTFESLSPDAPEKPERS